jgi:hypothetical protein
LGRGAGGRMEVLGGDHTGHVRRMDCGIWDVLDASGLGGIGDGGGVLDLRWFGVEIVHVISALTLNHGSDGRVPYWRLGFVFRDYCDAAHCLVSRSFESREEDTVIIWAWHCALSYLGFGAGNDNNCNIRLAIAHEQPTAHLLLIHVCAAPKSPEDDDVLIEDCSCRARRMRMPRKCKASISLNATVPKTEYDMLCAFWPPNKFRLNFKSDYDSSSSPSSTTSTCHFFWYSDPMRL